MKYLLFIAAIICALIPAGAETPSAIAIKDAHVVTVSGDEIAKGTVLLRDGLIQDEIGRASCRERV